MKVLLLIAHGSRNHGANAEITRLAEAVGELGGNGFDAVLPAFLELAEPTIRDGIERCVELGADEVVAVPYFLAAGNHVLRDVPQELARAGARHANLRIEIASHVGGVGIMRELVLGCAQAIAGDARVG